MAEQVVSDSDKVVLLPDNEFEEGLVLAGKMSAEALHHDTAQHALQQVQRVGHQGKAILQPPQPQQQPQQLGYAGDPHRLLAPEGGPDEAAGRQHLPLQVPDGMSPPTTKSRSDTAIAGAVIGGALPATHGSAGPEGHGQSAVARQPPQSLLEPAELPGGMRSEMEVVGKSVPAPSGRSGGHPEGRQHQPPPAQQLRAHSAEDPGGGGGPHFPPLGFAVRHVRDTVKGLVERVEKAVGILPAHEELSAGAAAVPSTVGAGSGDTAEALVHTAVHVLPTGVVLPPHDPAQAARERELEERREQVAAAEAAAALLQELPSLDNIRDSARGYVDAFKHSVRDRDEAAAELAGRMVGKTSYGHPHPHPHPHAQSQPPCMEPGGGGGGGGASAAIIGRGSSSPYRGGDVSGSAGGAALPPERFPPSPTGLRQLVVHPSEAAAELAGRMVGKSNYQHPPPHPHPHPHPHLQAGEQHQQPAPPGIGPHTRRVVNPVGFLLAAAPAAAVRQSPPPAVGGDTARGGPRSQVFGGPVSSRHGEQAPLAEAATEGSGGGCGCGGGGGTSAGRRGGDGAASPSGTSHRPPPPGSALSGPRSFDSGAGLPEDAPQSYSHSQVHPHPWGMRTSEDPESGMPLVALPSLRG